METLEQLKEIESKADAGGYTQVSLNGDSFYRFDGQNWIVYDGDEVEYIEYELPVTRSLSDIKLIIELMEAVSSLPDKLETDKWLEGLDRPTEFAISQAKSFAIESVFD